MLFFDSKRFDNFILHENNLNLFCQQVRHGRDKAEGVK
jgi:hypothetical protein